MDRQEREQAEFRLRQYRSNDLFARLRPLPIDLRAYIAAQVWDTPVDTFTLWYEKRGCPKLIGFHD